MIACMMVYNELFFLPVVLSQLASFCDDIYVQDNGSTDGSREFLRDQRGIKYYEVEQETPPDFARLRNQLLEHVADGAWVLQWDADELPTLSMRAGGLNGLVKDKHHGWQLPHWHLVHNRHTCFKAEAGYRKLRLFKKLDGVEYSGAVHEQVQVQGQLGGIPAEMGIGVVHLSYLAECRLARKAEQYARVPGSGFVSAEQLTGRVTDWPTMPLPKYVRFEAGESWLEELRYVS